MNHQERWKRAACIGKATRESDPWDPPDTDFEPPPAARAICEQCPIRIECLTDALTTNAYCVRGGLTRLQRNAIRRPRNRVKCPVCYCPDPVRIPGRFLQVCTSCGLTWRNPIPKTNPRILRFNL